MTCRTVPFPRAAVVAGAAGLEPVTSAVTGQRSNQLSYAPAFNYLRNNSTGQRVGGSSVSTPRGPDPKALEFFRYCRNCPLACNRLLNDHFLGIYSQPRPDYSPVRGDIFVEPRQKDFPAPAGAASSGHGQHLHPNSRAAETPCAEIIRARLRGVAGKLRRRLRPAVHFQNR